jgi:hypothetical protein
VKDSEAQAQLHSGGIPGSYPVVLDFDHNSEVKVGSWEAILSFHDFKLHTWKSTGIGPGKRFTKAELDKKYVQKDEQSRELQALQQEMQVPEQGLRFPQGSTGATFTTVLAEETFVPKFELCKTRKRERDAERDQKTAGRKKRSIDEKEAQQAKFQAVKDERAP